MGKNNHALFTGLFILALVALTTATILWIGHFHQQRSHYWVATRASVSGLNPESTVFFRGIAVGKVTAVNFDPNDSGIILVAIEVDKNIVLSQDVYAVLELKGVTGLTQLELEDSGKITAAIPPDDAHYRIPLVPSLTDKLLDSSEALLKKADHLMVRLGAFLSDDNEKNVNDILISLKALTGKLATLQKSVEKALLEVPGLSADTHNALANINALSQDLKRLSKEARALTVEATAFVGSGAAVGDLVVTTTLPKLNDVLTDLQTTSRQVKRVADLLEKHPQALILGPGPQPPGPGEPGFKDTK
jgi:phospholipid/cholesterol/gamma-HCH transport system substrate-binding protein